MATGVAVASFASVPVAEASGQPEGWRWGLGIWALTAVVAVPAWLLVAGRDRPDRSADSTGDATITIRDVGRTRVGWILAVFFGLQALQAYAIFGWLPTIYIDAGFSPATAGAFLGIATSVGIPLAFILPAYAARHRRPIGMMVVIVLSCLTGYLGLLIAPATTPWLWAALLAVGTSAFPVILTLIGLRARTSAGTSALSGFSQSVGYVLAAPGPFLVGVIYEATGTWTVPLLFLSALTVPFLVSEFSPPGRGWSRTRCASPASVQLLGVGRPVVGGQLRQAGFLGVEGLGDHRAGRERIDPGVRPPQLRSQEGLGAVMEDLLHLDHQSQDRAVALDDHGVEEVGARGPAGPDR